MNLFEELGEVLRPKKIVMVYLVSGIYIVEVDPSSGAKDIQEFLRNKYGTQVLSWE